MQFHANRRFLEDLSVGRLLALEKRLFFTFCGVQNIWMNPVERKVGSFLVAAGMAFLLTACGDALVEDAKKMRAEGFGAPEGTTYGQMFAEAMGEKALTWKQEKDAKLGEVAVATIPFPVKADLAKTIEAEREKQKAERVEEAKRDIEEYIAERIKRAEQGIFTDADYYFKNRPESELSRYFEQSGKPAGVHRRVLAELFNRKLASVEWQHNSLQSSYDFISKQIAQYKGFLARKGIPESEVKHWTDQIKDREAQLAVLKETMEVAPKLVEQYTKEAKEKEAKEKAELMEKAKTDLAPEHYQRALKEAEELDTKVGPWAHLTKSGFTVKFAKLDGEMEIVDAYIEMTWEDKTVFKEQIPAQVVTIALLKIKGGDVTQYYEEANFIESRYREAHGENPFANLFKFN